MKRKTLLIGVAFFCAVFLMSCGYKGTYDEGFSTGYEDGYSDGYNDGYSDAESSMQTFINTEIIPQYNERYENAHQDSYREHYSEGYYDALAVIEEAENYARKETGWSVYEAWNNICIYQDGVHPLGYDLPTKEEYQQSIDTLTLFCEYLDSYDFYD